MNVLTMTTTIAEESADSELAKYRSSARAGRRQPRLYSGTSHRSTRWKHVGLCSVG